MSWISFWIKPDAVPARVTLCVTSLLTLSTQHAQSQKSLPPVSYIKAIDIFMSSCTVFVFASLMEYALVNILMTADEKRNIHQQTTYTVNTATGHTFLLTGQGHGVHAGSTSNATLTNVNSTAPSTSRYTPGAATTVALSRTNAANTTTKTHLRVSSNEK